MSWERRSCMCRLPPPLRRPQCYSSGIASIQRWPLAWCAPKHTQPIRMSLCTACAPWNAPSERRDGPATLALGARSTQIAAAILAGLRLPLLAGVLLGTAGAMAWDGAFLSGLPGIYASAPPTLLKIAGFIILVVIVSCFIPLRRAAATTPIEALRHD